MMGDFVDLFFPLAFFLLALSLVGVVVAFFILDDERGLLLWIGRVLGSWLAAFAIILAGALIVQVWALAAAGRADGPDRIGANGVLTFNALISALAVAGWTVAFGALSLAGACFLLALWSTAVRVDADGITRQLAFGQDVIARTVIDRIVEVVYFFRITRDIREFRTRSFFVVLSRRGPLRRCALYRPTSARDEDEFRASAEKIAPLVLVPLLGLPLKNRLCE